MSGTKAFGRSVRDLWPLEAGTAYLNHGTVGVTPKAVLEAQTALRNRIEVQPAKFMLRDYKDLLRQAANTAAEVFGGRGTRLAANAVEQTRSSPGPRGVRIGLLVRRRVGVGLRPLNRLRHRLGGRGGGRIGRDGGHVGRDGRGGDVLAFAFPRTFERSAASPAYARAETSRRAERPPRGHQRSPHLAPGWQRDGQAAIAGGVGRAGAPFEVVLGALSSGFVWSPVVHFPEI